MNKRITTLFIIYVILTSWIGIVSGVQPKSLLGRGLPRSGKLLSSLGKEAYLSAYLLLGMFLMLRFVTNDLSTNLTTYILQNPPVYSAGFRNLIGFFIGLLQPFYILAIILTTFYIMFVSDSYARRSRAKSMLGNLVLGLIMISFSLPLLGIFFGVSESASSAILSQGTADTTIDEYNTALWQSYKMLGSSLLLRNIGAFQNFFAQIFSAPAGQLSKLFYNFFNKVKIPGEFGRSTPFLMFVILLTSGIYFIIALRYVMVMLWAALFPLTIFLTSFEMTKATGRTMIEQMVLWTSLQMFYATSFTAVGAALTVLPGWMYDTYSLSYHGLFPLSFFTLAAGTTLFFGPIVMFNLLQRLFPP